MAIIHRGTLWTDSETNTQYENDLLIQVDTVLIVIEAKAGMLHPSARRGAPERLQQMIRDLVIAPAVQARRFEKYLKSQSGVVSLKEKHGSEYELDKREIKDLICLSITLDFVGDLSAIQSTLGSTGWIPASIKLPPSMSLADLQNVFTLLDGVCPKLHYLYRRTVFEQAAKYMGDELDLLAVYMDRLFDLGPAETDGTRIMAYGAGQFFDRYFLELEQGRNPQKPHPRLSRWWANILAAVEKRLPRHWSQIALALLSLSPEDQERFGSLMLTVRQNVLQRKTPLEDTVTFVSGSPHNRVPVIGVAYVCATKEERDKRLANAAGGVRLADGTKPDRAVVIGCDPRIQGVPYSVLVMLYFENDDPPNDNHEDLR